MDPRTQIVTDLKLAACYRGLGFRYEADSVLHGRSGKLRVQFRFQLTSLRFPTLDLSVIHRQWLSGELASKDPMHVLGVMMTAQHNYDMLIKAQKEQCSLRLVECAGGMLMKYEVGTEQASILQSGMSINEPDMRLAAAVALVGLPVLRMPHNGKQHTFDLPIVAHPVRLSTGQWHLHDVRPLIQRAPTKDDPLRLALEDQQPLHPVVFAYDALFNRTELKRELSSAQAHRLIDAPGQRLTGHGLTGERLAVKQALVDLNPPGYVMDHVTAHFGSPPIRWE